MRWAEPLQWISGPFTDLSDTGAIEASFSWPAEPLLLGEAALVGGLLGTKDQEELLGHLPWAAVRFF